MFGNGAQIEFVCRSKHVTDRSAQSLVTVNEGRWAYCARGGTDHEWHPIEGMALEELARAMRTSEAGKQTAAAD